MQTSQAQQEIVLETDIVLDDTWVIENDTIIMDLTGHRMIFNHDKQKFKVINSYVVLKNFYPSDRDHWGGSINSTFMWYIGDTYTMLEPHKKDED